MHVLIDKDEAQREKSREQNDSVQRSLELTAKRAQLQGAGSGVEFKVDGFLRLRLHKSTSEYG